MTCLHRTVVTSLLLLLFSASASTAERSARPSRVDESYPSQLTTLQVRSTEPDSLERTVVHTGEAAWRVSSWVQGQELFKNFLDPAQGRADIYPFSVTEINMHLYFAAPTVLAVAVDVEDAIYVTPDYPIPGAPLAISADYQISIPAGGYYNITVPLDRPIEVTGPFFGGFFIGDVSDPSAGPAVLTDDSSDALGRCFNIWDEGIGFVDLLKNSFGNFPGRIILGAAGIAASDKPVVPPPKLTILHPVDQQELYANTTFWVHESSGSDIIEFVSFEYSAGDGFIELGRDYDGSGPVRDGIRPAGDGNGFCYGWDFSSLAEGTYTLRATAYDSKGRSDSDEITVYLEPTPPTPGIISLENGSDICGEPDIRVTCADENLSRVDLFATAVQEEYTSGLTVLKCDAAGPLSTAVAAATALQPWMDNRSLTLVDSERSPQAASLVRQIANVLNITDKHAASDEEIYTGLTQFCRQTDTDLQVQYACHPDYFTLRRLMQVEQKTIMIALGGTPGIWMAVDGFSGWKDDNGNFDVVVCDPYSGTSTTMPMRADGSAWMLKYDDNWQPVDRVIAIGTISPSTERVAVGIDDDGSDGWLLAWPTDRVTDNGLCFLVAEGTDENGMRDATAVLLNCDCSTHFEAGDYNDDGRADLVDLAYLIDFVVMSGQPPHGGAERADANGDNRLNIADVVYYSNYLFRCAACPSY